MILVDSSAWVEFDRATGSPTDQRLTALLRASPERITVTEPVIMELLAGAKDGESAAELGRMLAAFHLLHFDPISDFEAAATIYRSCRRAGITPRGLIDCQIAAVALRTGATLLTGHRDFAGIATVMPLRLV